MKEYSTEQPISMPKIIRTEDALDTLSDLVMERALLLQERVPANDPRVLDLDRRITERREVEKPWEEQKRKDAA